MTYPMCSLSLFQMFDKRRSHWMWIHIS
jgi:hypothetical protein